jgi:two-component system, chemotaxis family, protein-glutamate methylesterase/glutaminase
MERHEPSLILAPSWRTPVVALASSTGGPQALQELFAALPSDFSVPILAVQHITKGYLSHLVNALAANCRVQVKLAGHREPLARGTIYMAPDDYHLGVADQHTIELSGAPPVERFRPSATWLFSSVARHFGAATVAVILSGTGQDGIAGLVEIQRAGGLILAQDEQSSAAYGMPRAAVEARLPDFVLPLPAIADRLIALSSQIAMKRRRPER